MYSSIGGGAQATVAEQVRKAVGSVSQGFTALKMRMDWSSRSVESGKDWEIVTTASKEVGDKIDLQYDANNGLRSAQPSGLFYLRDNLKRTA